MLTNAWFRYFGESILNLIVPDKQLAALAGSYLRVLIFGLWVFKLYKPRLSSLLTKVGLDMLPSKQVNVSHRLKVRYTNIFTCLRLLTRPRTFCCINMGSVDHLSNQCVSQLGACLGTIFTPLIPALSFRQIANIRAQHPTFGIGFLGAPVAVVITNWLMPLLLFLYVRFIGGSDCWGGFSKKAWQNWWPMVILHLI